MTPADLTVVSAWLANERRLWPSWSMAPSLERILESARRVEGLEMELAAAKREVRLLTEQLRETMNVTR